MRPPRAAASQQATEWPAADYSTQRRRLGAAALGREARQRGANAQPTIGSRQRRHHARDLRQPRPRAALVRVDVEPRDRRAAAPRVYGCSGSREQRLDRRLLDLAAGVHHDDALRRLGDHAEVVRDQHDRGAGRSFSSQHQVQDLRLDRDVERRGRLVGDQHLRVAGERHRDHHALAHAAGKLVRILVERGAGLARCDQLEHLDAPARAPRSATAAVQHQLSAICVPTVSTGLRLRHRLLEDHRDPVAAHRAHLRARTASSSSSPVEADRAADDAAGRAARSGAGSTAP